MTGHFLAAERLLLHPLPSSQSQSSGSASVFADILGKGKAKQSDVEIATGRLADKSLACRYLAAQCLVGHSFHAYEQRESYRNFASISTRGCVLALAVRFKLTRRSSENTTKRPSCSSVNQILSVWKNHRPSQAPPTVASSYTRQSVISEGYSTYACHPF